MAAGTTPSPTPPHTDLPWWRHAVIYQVYIRSFADADGDGTGDLNGLRSKLDYLAELGVDAVWVNPWYDSPLADGGYDVADYRSIEPRYGTLDQAEALITEAHERGIKVVADLVPNHTSERHAWFEEALASPPGSAARDRYHFLDGKGADGSEPPNDWTSVFGGPAWTRVPDGQWYLHLFTKEQPDLNWENPEVRTEFEDILRFWLDRGIDGFRVDVAHGLVKAPGYPDLGAETEGIMGAARRDNHPFWDRDEIHEIIRGWRSVLDGYDGDRMMVAEAWVLEHRLPLYLRPDEYHQSFNFAFLEAFWRADDFRTVIDEAVTAASAIGSTSTWVLSNHDVMRETTRYGLPPDVDWRLWPAVGPFDILDPEAGLRRARAAALLLLGLPGSAYVYQGEELGLPEYWDLPDDVLDDPVWERSNHEYRGRDGCRVPIPWEPDGPSLGFGPGDPWLPQPVEWSSLAASVQSGDPTSTLELYRRVLALRRTWGATDEQLEMLDLGPDVVAFRRGSGLVCLVNLGTDPVDLPDHTEVLVRSDSASGSGSGDGATVAPDEAVWFH